MVEGAALLKLMTCLSPAFPTGGFAYSHALEWSVEAGDITEEAALKDWIEDLLQHGSLWNDVLLLRAAHQAPGDLAGLAELALSLGGTAERRLEASAQGAAFLLAAAAYGLPRIDVDLTYPLAIGAIAAAAGIAQDDAALAFLHAATANLISAGIRLIPLGQAAGLRIQAALAPAILATEAATRTATLDELGGCAWASDIAAMRHETQTTRLFRT
jgi:urease accessory protein